MKLPSTTDSNREQICLNTLSLPSISSQSKSRIQFNKVLIIGLGQLGLPVAKYANEKGFDTYGYDISHQAIENAKKTAGVKRAINFSDFDVYILCISTHKSDDMFTPQIDGLLSIVERISQEAKTGALVSIESTIPKGASNRIFELLNHRLHVVHAPHRWYALEEKEHGVNQLRVIGGVCNCCLKAGMQFYNGSVGGTDTSTKTIDSSSSDMAILNSSPEDGKIYDIGKYEDKDKSNKSLDIRMHPVSKIEIAETTKIVENTHRYLQIAFAEELYLYCQVNNINFSELRDALNTKWNVNILEPKEGIGGHCLPKDTKMFLQSSKIENKILTAAIQADEDYRWFRSNLNRGLKSTVI
jgi:UDP-N-acetyl-D-mannosaminuronic acid dehydrogenase